MIGLLTFQEEVSRKKTLEAGSLIFSSVILLGFFIVLKVIELNVKR